MEVSLALGRRILPDSRQAAALQLARYRNRDDVRRESGPRQQVVQRVRDRDAARHVEREAALARESGVRAARVGQGRVGTAGELGRRLEERLVGDVLRSEDCGEGGGPSPLPDERRLCVRRVEDEVEEIEPERDEVFTPPHHRREGQGDIAVRRVDQEGGGRARTGERPGIRGRTCGAGDEDEAPAGECLLAKRRRRRDAFPAQPARIVISTRRFLLVRHSDPSMAKARH